MSHLFRVKTDEDANVFHESTCLTCNLGEECKFNDILLSNGGSYYTVNCLGPGVPKSLIRKTCEQKDAVEPMVIISSNERLRRLIAQKAMPRVKEMTVPLSDGFSEWSITFTQVMSNPIVISFLFHLTCLSCVQHCELNLIHQMLLSNYFYHQA